MSKVLMSKEAEKVRDAYQHSKESFKTMRTDSERAMRYTVNNPYNTAQKSAAKTFKKPLLKYNIIIPIINALQGNEQMVNRRPRFKPRNQKSVESVEIIQGRWNAIWDEQDLDTLTETSFYDALITKMGGWTERGIEINNDGLLDYVYKVPNNFRIFLDPETKTSDYQLLDCKWVIKEGWMTIDDLENKYKRKLDLKSVKDIKWYNQLSEIFKRITDSSYTKGSEDDKENDRYKVLEMQEKVTERKLIIWDGNDYTLADPNDWKKLKRDNPNLELIREYDRTVIWLTTVVPYFEYTVVMNEKAKWNSANFDLFPTFSFAFNMTANETTSLVDLLLDIQDDINKGKSQIRDYVTKKLAATLYMNKREKDAIKLIEKKGNQPNLVVPLSDMSNVPEQLPPEQVDPLIMINTENSYLHGERLSGVTAAVKGQSERSGESGTLFEQKVQRAAAVINPYFKNKQNMLKTMAKDFVDNFDFVYSERDRIIMTKDEDTGEFQEQIINLEMGDEIINDVSNPSLFVELDEGEDNMTSIETNFERGLALLNLIATINPEMASQLAPTLIEEAPLKNKEKWLQRIGETLSQQSKEAGEQSDLEKTSKILEQERLASDIVTDQERLAIEAQQAQNQNQNQPGGDNAS